jgi:hypothetical protein
VAAKKKPVFDDTDNSSDFVSCDSAAASSCLGSPEFSFKLKHKTPEKESSFDK